MPHTYIYAESHVLAQGFLQANDDVASWVFSRCVYSGSIDGTYPWVYCTGIQKSLSLKAVLRGINSGLLKAGTFVEGHKGVVWCGMLWSLVSLPMEWWQLVAHVERTHSDFKCNGVVWTTAPACVIWEHFGVVACM